MCERIAHEVQAAAPGRGVQHAPHGGLQPLTHGRPAPIRSDQGPEFIAAAVKAWIAGVGARTAYIEQASLCRPQSRS
jgi:transposase InsO family protein